MTGMKVYYETYLWVHGNIVYAVHSAGLKIPVYIDNMIKYLSIH